jgi:alpha-L-rhamnosidase
MIALMLLQGNLRTEYRVDPMGIETPRPRFSWSVDRKQTAYQIVVDGLWDSGKVESSRTIGIEYAGKPLQPGQRVGWKVRVWDDKGPSEWSAPATFEMAIADWQAMWISGKTLFRKQFALDKRVARARAYVSGLGYYELQLNGKRVGDHMLDPGWTTYSKRVLYSTYDITALLKAGPNSLRAMVGNGWFNPLPLKMWGSLNIRKHLTVGEPCLIAQIHIEFEDGSTQLIGTDESWQTADGPIVKNSVYLGEEYDARKEEPDTWEPATVVQGPGPLHPQSQPPIRITRTLKAKKLGNGIYDFGQNFAGWVRMRVQGEAGTRVTLRYGELLNADGTLNGLTSVCGQIKSPKNTAWQQDAYILKGGGVEEWTPRFTFHGFRYVEVKGAEVELEGLRLNSDVAPAGEFACSNELFNRIHEMVLWTQLSNMFSIQSDCPHREKFGYGGDIVAAAEMAILNFDMNRFYAKVVQDFADAARADGGITETAPFVGIADEGVSKGAGPVEWGTAYPYLQWLLYQYYGDRRILEEHYEATRKWVELLESKAKDGVLDNGISDHESLVPKPRAVTGTGFYYWNALLMSKIARALDQAGDAERFEKLAQSIARAFGTLKNDTQCGQALALYFGLSEQPVQERQKLTTGIFGTRFLLPVLPAEEAYAIVNRKTFPGWGYMLEKGATTLWEHWEFSDNTYSHNHPMFGSVDEWFYKVIGGISPAPDAVGFDKIIIRPRPVGDLTWAKARYESVRGTVKSEWKIEGGEFTLTVTIPPGTTAKVHVLDKVYDMEPGTRIFSSRR